MPGTRLKDVSALVLAGGRGSRIGRDKALIRFGGQPLVELVASRAAGVFDQVLVSGPESLEVTGFPVVQDKYPGRGPMAGILSGLIRAGTDWIMVLPCDSPFVPLEFMKGMAGLRDDHEVVVPRAGDRYEPLHALYRHTLIPRIEQSMAQGESKIISLYQSARRLEVGPEIYGQWDPQQMAFFNINTEADLRRAKRHLLSTKDNPSSSIIV